MNDQEIKNQEIVPLTVYLNDINIPLIEKVFSYKPENRRGYSDRRSREIRIANSIGLKLYNKRVPIAEDIVKNRHLKPEESLNLALVNNGISPHSVTGLNEYVNFIIKFRGGWDSFCNELEENLSFYRGINREYKNVFYYVLLINLIIFNFYLLLHSLTNINIAPIYGILIAVAICAVMVGKVSTETKKNRTKWLGKTKKSHELFRYNRIKTELLTP